MEQLLHYIWKNRLYSESELQTTEGASVFVVDPGLHNKDAGPDFFNAKIRINGTLWAGNVEIHERASDWFAHHHDKDKSYDSVILHVVKVDDAIITRTNQEKIPQAVLRIPSRLEQKINGLLSDDTPLRCRERIGELPKIHLSAWMNALVAERLERKTHDILKLHQQYTGDWNEVFYVTLMRNFGFGTNSDAFEWLAKSLPYKDVLKHRNNLLQVEALLFGQAGLLDDEDDGGGMDEYFASLQREYAFLRSKYGLKPVSGFLFKRLRTRPVNFPHLRIAQLAAFWSKEDVLFSKIIETENIDDVKKFFHIRPSDYWSTHYHFLSPSFKRTGAIGSNAVLVILINTIVPILFAYGKQKNLPQYCGRALKYLEGLSPERNSVVDVFRNAGVEVESALDTQALIQLRREYCDKRKCLYCRIGYRILKN